MTPLESFTKYCKENPELRFWQALRNWSKYDFIMGWSAEEFDLDKANEMGLKDTFYIEDSAISEREGE